MSATRIMIMNCVLFAIIVATSAFMLRQENSLPGTPPVRELRAAVEERLANEPSDGGDSIAKLEKLGSVNLFDTIIPTPTPAPTPSPTPVAPPDIADVVKEWKLSGVLTSYALFQNKKTKEEWQMKIGESHIEKFRNKEVKVYLDSIDKKSWGATVRINEEGQVQKKKLSVF